MTRSFVNRPEECSDVYRLKSPIDLKLALTRLLKSSLLADLSEIDRSLLCTLASELGSNMIKYARHGNLHVSRKDTLSFCVVEVKAVDQGPGIADIEKAMAEHFSSGGTLGLGLPGVKRLADNLEISSVPGVGTTIIATKRIRRALAPVKSPETRCCQFLWPMVVCSALLTSRGMAPRRLIWHARSLPLSKSMRLIIWPS